jgi:triosephosphate isomerase
MRKLFVAGNWKMYTTAASARDLATAVVRGLGSTDRVTVGVFPPFPYLGLVAEAIRGSKLVLGAQNLYPAKEGAFTGEVSPVMLRDVGCQYVIVGHSERRHKLEESNAFINQKVLAALAAGLNVILCVGETLEQRQTQQTERILDEQITSGLVQVAAEVMNRVVVAYEPVWAIGTGQNATPDQAQGAHVFLRKRVRELYSAAIAEALVIQYGGSVKPDNAASLLHQPDVDGALVGGACLQADSFLAIIRAGLSA